MRVSSTLRALSHPALIGTPLWDSLPPAKRGLVLCSVFERKGLTPFPLRRRMEVPPRKSQRKIPPLHASFAFWLPQGRTSLGSVKHHAQGCLIQIRLPPCALWRLLEQKKAVRALSGFCFLYCWRECISHWRVASLSGGSKKGLQSQALQAESLDPSSPLTEDSPNRPLGSSVASGCRSRSGIRTFCSASQLPHVGPFQGDLIRVRNSKIHCTILFLCLFLVLASLSWKFTRLTGSSFRLLWYHY